MHRLVFQLIVFLVVVTFGVGPAVRADAPGAPTNPLPASGAVGVAANPSICADVTDPDGDPLDVKFFGRDLTATPAEDFTIIVIPDTQYYSQTYPEIFYSQTDWIAANREALNIAFVSHVGDIVQRGGSDFEWIVADDAMSRLEDPATTGLAEGIPYGMSVGNHDQDGNNRAGDPGDEGSTTVKFNEYFGVSRYAGKSYWGGHYLANNDNSYQLFEAGGMEFVIVHTEFDSTFQTLLTPTLEWVDGVLDAHADRRAILSSHHLLCPTTACPNDTNDWSSQGLATYDKVKDNQNLFLMITGHSSHSAYQPRRTDMFDGHTIHTFLANYQRGEVCPLRCGNGFLRIMTFSPANNEIQMATYSPWLDEYKTDDEHQFTLPYDMEGGIQFEQVGELIDVGSGMSPCVGWTGREKAGQYEWYVTVADDSEQTVGPRWDFVASGSCTAPSDCDEGDPCTQDDCVGSVCSRTGIPGCCESDADCSDGDPCTDDLCDVGNCSNPQNSAPCVDGNPCTENDVCSVGVCAGTALDCDDTNGCTDDSCQAGECESEYVVLNQCCTVDAECNDGVLCTDDVCDGNGDCQNVPDPSCCEVDSECDDVDVCTADRCHAANRKALRFNGAEWDHVTMGRVGIEGNVAEPPGTGATEFTIETWFKWDGGGQTTTTSGYCCDFDPGGIVAYPLVSKGHTEQETITERSVNYSFGIDRDTSRLTADFEEDESGPNPAFNHPVIGTTPVSVGVWHHAAVTYDGDCWQLYLDGTAETDGTNCPGVVPAYRSEHHFAIGSGHGWEGWVDGGISGMMDEVRLWRTALTHAELLANMNTIVEHDPRMLGRWGFDGTDGFTVSDSTGNENIGVVVGAEIELVDLVDLGGAFCEYFGPAELTHLELTGPGQVRWNDPRNDFLFDLAGGLLSELRTQGNTTAAICLENDAIEPTHQETRSDPPPGDGYYYMVREQSQCEAAPYGFASAGPEWLPTAACP